MRRGAMLLALMGALCLCTAQPAEAQRADGAALRPRPLPAVLVPPAPQATAVQPRRCTTAAQGALGGALGGAIFGWGFGYMLKALSGGSDDPSVRRAQRLSIVAGAAAGAMVGAARASCR